jgi:hypothetical protein
MLKLHIQGLKSLGDDASEARCMCGHVVKDPGHAEVKKLMQKLAARLESAGTHLKTR